MNNTFNDFKAFVSVNKTDSISKQYKIHAIWKNLLWFLLVINLIMLGTNLILDYNVSTTSLTLISLAIVILVFGILLQSMEIKDLYQSWLKKQTNNLNI